LLLLGRFDNDCQELVPRSASQPAAGVTRVVIVARAGFLHVEGKSGAKAIVADGMACAAIEELLVGIRLEATRSGSTVTVDAQVPKDQPSRPFAKEPKLDVTITLPPAVDVVIADTSGDIRVRHLAGNLRIADTSGEIDVDDIGGDFTVEIKKGSGAIRHTRVRGRVSLPTSRSSPPR
jgi:hypothetical protein